MVYIRPCPHVHRYFLKQSFFCLVQSFVRMQMALSLNFWKTPSMCRDIHKHDLRLAFIHVCWIICKCVIKLEYFSLHVDRMYAILLDIICIKTQTNFDIRRQKSETKNTPHNILLTSYPKDSVRSSHDSMPCSLCCQQLSNRPDRQSASWQNSTHIPGVCEWP